MMATSVVHSWHSPDLEASTFAFDSGSCSLVVSRRGQRTSIDFTPAEARMIGLALVQTARQAKLQAERTSAVGA